MWWPVIVLVIVLSILAVVLVAVTLRINHLNRFQYMVRDAWLSHGNCPPTDPQCVLREVNEVAPLPSTMPTASQYEPSQARTLAEFVARLDLASAQRMVRLPSSPPHAKAIQAISSFGETPYLGMVWKYRPPGSEHLYLVIGFRGTMTLTEMHHDLNAEQVTYPQWVPPAANAVPHRSHEELKAHRDALQSRQRGNRWWRRQTRQSADTDPNVLSHRTQASAEVDTQTSQRLEWDGGSNVSMGLMHGLQQWMSTKDYDFGPNHRARQSARATNTRDSNTEEAVNPPMVHMGFYLTYMHLRSELYQILEAYQSEVTGLWFTGHSLGAALATLAAMDFSDPSNAVQWLQTQNVSVAAYLFGVPKVGDAGLEELANDWLQRPDVRLRALWRVYNRYDVLQDMPPSVVPNFRNLKEETTADSRTTTTTDPETHENEAPSTAPSTAPSAAPSAAPRAAPRAARVGAQSYEQRGPDRGAFCYHHVGQAAGFHENWESMRVNHFMPYYIYACERAQPQ